VRHQEPRLQRRLAELLVAVLPEHGRGQRRVHAVALQGHELEQFRAQWQVPQPLRQRLVVEQPHEGLQHSQPALAVGDHDGDQEQRPRAGRVHRVEGLLQLVRRHLHADQQHQVRWPRHRDRGLGQGERQVVLGHQELLGLRLGQQGLLQHVGRPVRHLQPGLGGQARRLGLHLRGSAGEAEPRPGERGRPLHVAQRVQSVPFVRHGLQAQRREVRQRRPRTESQSQPSRAKWRQEVHQLQGPGGLVLWGLVCPRYIRF